MRIILLAILLPSSIFAQDVMRCGNETTERVHQFGFLLGTNLPQKDGRIGLTTGIVYEFEPVRIFAFGINPNLSFTERFSNDQFFNQTVLELPIYAIYEPWVERVRPQFGFGIEPTFEIGGVSRLYGNFSVGCEFQLPYFTLCPRFRYAFANEVDRMHFSLIFKSS